VLAHKAVRAGFYWPNMNKNSAEIVRNCDKCQRFANITKQPPEELTAISSPCLFSQWGVDIVVPLSREKGGSIRSGRGRLLHQMGRSRTPSEHNDQNHSAVPVEKCRLPLRCATCICH
jgi:hypothetical protein